METKELFDRNAKDAVKVYKNMGSMGSMYGIYIYIPGTQMSLVLIGKDLLLEAKQRTNGFQVYTFVIYVCLHDQLIFMGKYSIHGSYGIQRDVEKEGKFSDSDITHSFPWD